MGTGDTGKAAIRPELDRRQAMSLVSDALTTIIPGLQGETLDEGQELYADLGLDSLGLARLLIALEGKLGVQLVDEYLMTIDLEKVADLVALVERAAPPAARLESLRHDPCDDLLSLVDEALRASRRRAEG